MGKENTLAVRRRSVDNKSSLKRRKGNTVGRRSKARKKKKINYWGITINYCHFLFSFELWSNVCVFDELMMILT